MGGDIAAGGGGEACADPLAAACAYTFPQRSCTSEAAWDCQSRWRNWGNTLPGASPTARNFYSHFMEPNPWASPSLLPPKCYKISLSMARDKCRFGSTIGQHQGHMPWLLNPKLHYYLHNMLKNTLQIYWDIFLSRPSRQCNNTEIKFCQMFHFWFYYPCKILQHFLVRKGSLPSFKE